MRTDDSFMQIIMTCISIEKKAVMLYRKFSDQAADEDLKLFWREMSDEERTHIDHWTYLLSLDEQGVVPHFFNDLERVREHLDEIHSKVTTLVGQSNVSFDVTSAFTLACHLEFYMLSKEFTYLHHFMQSVQNNSLSEDAYAFHLNKFFDGLKRFSRSPELRLLGETIHRVFLENRELLLQSNSDPLTGRFNKRGFMKSIVPLAYLARRNNFTAGMMMIDIDRFKEINDTFGHMKGDEVLKLVADSIESHVRRSDLVARYGGDEFLVYLSEVDDHRLLNVGEKIRSSIEVESKETIPVTVSIGIAYTLLGDDVENELNELIENADFCLYQAKQHNNRVVVMHEKRAHLTE